MTPKEKKKKKKVSDKERDSAVVNSLHSFAYTNIGVIYLWTL
jgi:hypothetical protein